MSNATTVALADQLKELLRLAVPPVGIAFRSESDTDGIEQVGGVHPAPTEDGRTGAVSAPCVFWFLGTERVFSTVKEDHANCSVGSYTHGFKTLEEVASKNDVGALVQSGWVTPEDFPRVPAVKDRPGSIVYGPLDRMPVDPDIVFLRLNAKQAMMLDDALGGVRFEGKPQCHVLANSEGRPRDRDQRRLHAEPGAYRDAQRRDELRHPPLEARRHRRSSEAERGDGTDGRTLCRSRRGALCGAGRVARSLRAAEGARPSGPATNPLGRVRSKVARSQSTSSRPTRRRRPASSCCGRSGPNVSSRGGGRPLLPVRSRPGAATEIISVTVPFAPHEQ
ncbi:DUF169 domain-containing protein [Lutibaculum baratangense]|uniref:DUF169 domain-containing protein n=1 Tax=Lutibaculum baratangense TaxID=1358440 RepID=UPI0009DECE46|nr:DUF169 domain-containing protein [Lutibaculum baratangense]